MRRVRKFSLLAGAAAVTLVACGQQPADRAIIKELKILAVRAEPPEVSPGASATLDALVVDPLGAGRPVTRIWALCAPDPVQGVSSCTDPARITPLGLGSAATVTVPATALDGLPADQQLRGIDFFVVLAVHADASGTIAARDTQAFKRLRVSTSPTPNQNPRLIRFDIGGTWLGPATVKANDSIPMSATVTSNSRESYSDSTATAHVEDMKFTWLATDGQFADAVSFDDTPGSETPGTGSNVWLSAPPSTLWVVVRDPRGGIDWMTRDVSATP